MWLCMQANTVHNETDSHKLAYTDNLTDRLTDRQTNTLTDRQAGRQVGMQTQLVECKCQTTHLTRNCVKGFKLTGTFT